MRGIRGRKRNLPAGNWAPYVQACLRKSLWFRFVALLVSSLGTAFFAAAVWFALGGEDLLGINAMQAGLAFCGQLGASLFLALDLRAARRDQRGQRGERKQ